nr:SMC5-SMC6 complex localization factor protein 2 isoform X3 [Pelodiscus sinensis]|eukprot:XP_025039301.1 SMC5-SMC6 complex localization factor protein 2 isoform X3 [Pelodiscus sinensis]
MQNIMRNQSITDFFKPAPKQDRILLCSPDKRNVKNGVAGLSVTCTEQFEKKISSEKKTRRETFPVQPANRSPVIDGLLRGTNREKKDSPNVLENNRACMVPSTKYPKVVVRKLLMSACSPNYSLTKKDKTSMREPGRNEKCPTKTRTSLFYENGREQQIERMDLEEANSNPCKRVSTSEADTLNYARNNDNVNNKPLCQKPGHSTKLQHSSESQFWLPLDTYCREGEQKRQRMEQPKLQPFSPVKAFSRSGVLNQGNGCLVRKRSSSTSWETTSDDSSQSKQVSPPVLSRWSTEKAVNIWKKQSFCLSSISSGLSKQKDFPGKRKRISVNMDLKNSGKPVVFNELNIETSSITSVNRKLSNSSDSGDESFDCSLDSDEEEMLLPLQDILSSSSKPHGGTPEGTCPEDLSQDTLTPSPKLPLSKLPVVSQVSYVNSLEHLLKEKEESKRVDELEKQLQEDIQEIGLNSSTREEEQENSDEDRELSEEHRAFIKRFSIVTDAIPDYHPGEEIFHLSNSGKIFNQHNLDLRNSGFIPQNPIEKLLLRSEVTQQLSLATQGFLSCAYSCTLCPIPVSKWLFQMMSIHSDYYVSMQILDTLMEITIKNASIGDTQSKLWIPSLSDISAVFINMGVPFQTLFPLQHFQPIFTEDDILSEMQITVEKRTSGNISAAPAFSCLPETNLINVVKFLCFCTTMYPDGYADQEILLLLLLLFKISLEKLLKQIPLIDFQCLLIKLLKNIRDWDAKMPQLSLTISELSSHHHDLLWLVQLVPSWVKRGRQMRQHLSLTIISKLLNKKYISLPDTSDLQMSLLYQYLVQMKPSDILKKMIEERKKQQQDELSGECAHTELEQQAYYLTYILLHLVSEVSCFDIVNSNQRKCLLRLCGALEKHVKCDIREDARLFYRTKVKDLVARIYGKWQEMIQNSRPTQGKLHDFWEPDL